MRVGFGSDGDLFDDLDVIGLKADDFAGVVGKESDFVNAEVGEDLGTKPVIAEVHGESEAKVGFHGIESVLLEFVGADFRTEADAASFLAHIEEDAISFFLDALHGLVELRAAIAAAGSEDVAGEAFAMDTNEGGLGSRDLSLHEGDVVHVVDEGAIEVEVEITKVGGHEDGLLAFDKAFTLAAVGDEILDRAHLETVFVLEFDQIRQAGHGAILFHNLADNARGIEPSKAG